MVSEIKYDGYRIWEIQKNKIPKEVTFGNDDDLLNDPLILNDLDLKNKTYAIRIGKLGLK